MVDFTDFYVRKMASAVLDEAIESWDYYQKRSYRNTFSVDEVKRLLVKRFQKIKKYNDQYPEVEEFVLHFFSEVNYEILTEECNRLFREMHLAHNFEIQHL